MSDTHETPAKPDWRSTVFLPKTDFPMKAGLPAKEPGILAKWQADGAYQQLRAARAGREKYILHDGPPYANGDIHIGHALNHILKDMVVRTQTLLGKDAPYVPGWDCHGLPIEWKVEEQYRKKKLDKDQVPLVEFRAECRAYAQHWVDVQREQLKRLGIGGDWDKPYLTMDPEAEGTIVAELMKFAESGQLYRGAKPVMWSPVEKTALAEAEIEYEDVTSTQIDVAFEIVESPVPELVGAYAVIWTTTPWTIPVNQAIAYGPEVEYYVSEYAGKRYLLANMLGAEFDKRWLAAEHPRSEWTKKPGDDISWNGTGSDLAGTIARHPMHHLGGFFAKPRPFLPGEFVTTDTGTGLVHMAPDHGEDDFALCKANGIEPVFAVEGDGKYRADWAWLGGQGSVINTKFNAPDGQICADLREAGALLAASDFKHSYPHSWRSKARVIYRCTPQWFIGMDMPLSAEHCESFAEQRWDNEGGSIQGAGPTLRHLATQAIAATRFVPEKGRNRIGSMVADRPDWVISRQRAWGVPIALFVKRGTNAPLLDPAVNARIVAAVKAGGVDAWSDERAQEYLGADYVADDYERVTDILDVWFDSGCTHAFVLESARWPDLQWPADLYLEGSDQHRGWFQSSLMESCGTRGRAPYDAVLTHGFTMDAKGMKMSKSLGNTINPIDLMRDYGADILRLWALSVDFTEDHRIGKEILAGVADQYRKLRNTFRYLLGALEGFEPGERVAVEDMPELERYMLSLLAELDGKLRAAVADYDFNSYTRLLGEFANNDLSAFYFDIRKDSLYCDVNAETGVQTDKRRAYRTVLDAIFEAMVRWAAPVLVFTAEEVWGTRWPDAESVHLAEWPEIGDRLDGAIAKRWGELRATRMIVNEAIEPMRRAKEIGSSLEVEVDYPGDAGQVDLSELFIVSTVRQGLSTALRKTTNHKCGRCWRHLPEVTEDGDLCGRCEGVVHAA
ncbi:isoleucine--tRNA ligase [Sphingomonas sp. RB1R13]|uniref:isoleucine--tRNA ligase n=1 Tax=Sphingomonas sp. RB1R13 TaxID=3096159 RepID=UPI002FCA271E